MATRVLPLCYTTIYDYYKVLICKYKLAQPARGSYHWAAPLSEDFSSWVAECTRLILV
jgi:hypothetical protein